MEQSFLSQTEIKHLYDKLNDIHVELKELNGSVKENTHFRISYEALKLPDHLENLQNQFKAHYKETSNLKAHIYMISVFGSIIGGFILSIVQGYILNKI